jgi:nucleoside-diphosphate-sugar epimerase
MLSVFRPVFRLGVHLAFFVAYSRYSLIHVSDLVDSLILCAQSGARLEPPGDRSVASAAAAGPPSGYYFVAGDEQPTFAELGTLIGIALGRARVIICRSPSTMMLWPSAAVAEVLARLRGQPFIFNFDKAREVQAGSWTCSAQAVRTQVGFVPSAPLIERLRQTANWYRQQNLL